MPFLLLDDFDAAGLWTALDAANAASAEIVVSADTVPHPHAATAGTLRLEMSGAATGHLIRRDLAAVDLSAHDRLTFWCRSDAAMQGGPQDDLRLRIRLGSATLAIGAVGNAWHRYLSCPAAGMWAYQSFDLADLPAQVRNSLSRIEVDIPAIAAAQTFWLDGMEARRIAVVSDVDAALLARLDGGLVLGGVPVPARVAPDMAANPPFIRLVQYESSHGGARATHALRAGDHSDAGHVLRPPPVPWDLLYRADFVADARADEAAMLDFVLDRLGYRDWLRLGNQAVRIDQIPATEPDDALRDRPAIRYRVSAWAEPGTALPVRPVSEIVLATDLAGAGA